MKKKIIIPTIIVFIIIIAIGILLGGFGLLSISDQNKYNFEWKNITWECTGSGSTGTGTTMGDTDFRDGRIQYINEPDAISSASVIVGNTISVSSNSYGENVAATSIGCKATSLPLDKIQEIKFKSTGSISIGGDGQCGVSLNRAGISNSMSCPNYPYSRSQSFADFTLSKSFDRFVVNDGSQQAITNEIGFSLNTALSSGRVSSSGSLNIDDIAITCIDGYIYKDGDCIEDDTQNVISELESLLEEKDLTAQELIDKINELELSNAEKSELIDQLKLDLEEKETIKEQTDTRNIFEKIWDSIVEFFTRLFS